jgi:hypothetical protein
MLRDQIRFQVGDLFDSATDLIGSTHLHGKVAKGLPVATLGIG